MKITVHGTHPLHEKDLYEMARVGYADNLEISVWTNDPGEIPHFHVTNDEPRGKASRVDACIQLEQAKYFSHGKHKGTLNASQRKALDRFFREKPKYSREPTNYDLAVSFWNSNNSNRIVVPPIDKNGDTVIPDYTNIEEYKK